MDRPPDNPESTLFQSIEALWRDVTDFVTKLREAVAKFAADADATRVRARQGAEDLLEDASDMIDREPIQVAIIAFAIGCALGLLFTAGSNRRR